MRNTLKIIGILAVVIGALTAIGTSKRRRKTFMTLLTGGIVKLYIEKMYNKIKKPKEFILQTDKVA